MDGMGSDVTEHRVVITEHRVVITRPGLGPSIYVAIIVFGSLL